MKIFTIALGLLALVPANAEARDAAPVVRVSVADLNLHSEAGVRTLDRRLARAVRTVCAEGSTDLARQLAARHCIVATTAALAAERNRAVAAAAAANVTLAALTR